MRDDHLDIRELGLGPDPASVDDLLVLRPGGLGEMVKTVPALRHLRRTYRGARITVVAGRAALDLLDGCPYVDRLVAIESPGATLEARFDLAFSCADPTTTAPRGRAVPGLADVDAAVKVGFRKPGTNPVYQVHPLWPARRGEVERLLRLAWLLGGIQPDSSISLWPTLASRNAAARLLDGVVGPVALVHPGARDARHRRWPIEGFARCIDALSALGLQPVTIGTASDAPLTHELRALCTAPFVDLVGRTSVGELAGLLERAALLVGNDSGPATLAAALDVQAVVVGPATTLEQLGTVDVVSYVTSGPCDECHTHGCRHGLGDAAGVPFDPVLAEVVLAGERAARRWSAARIA